jgi:hypothetical protein
MKQIFTAGWPRSGNTWLNRLLGDLLNSPLQIPGDPNAPLEHFGPGRDGGYVIRKTHLMPNEKPDGGPTVFIHRDPRDVAVSAFFYRGGPDKTTLMQVIESMTVAHPKHANITYHQPGVYKRMVEGWLEAAEVTTSYEMLYYNGHDELLRIGQALGVEGLTWEWCGEVHKRQYFGNLAARYPHSMRKGIAGDWKNHFGKQEGRRITQILGKLMIEQGYIDDLGWWR